MVTHHVPVTCHRHILTMIRYGVTLSGLTCFQLSIHSPARAHLVSVVYGDALMIFLQSALIRWVTGLPQFGVLSITKLFSFDVTWAVAFGKHHSISELVRIMHLHIGYLIPEVDLRVMLVVWIWFFFSYNFLTVLVNELGVQVLKFHLQWEWLRHFAGLVYYGLLFLCGVFPLFW